MLIFKTSALSCFLGALLLTSTLALPTNALAAADKSELYRLAKEMVRLQSELDVLESRKIDKSLPAQYRNYISTLPADQVADLVAQYKEGVVIAQAKIEAIKAPPPVRTKALLSELDGLRDEYQILLRRYTKEFAQNSRLKPIFKMNPYHEYDERYGLDADDLPAAGEELTVYRKSINNLKIFHTQINSISAKDIRNVLQSVGSSKRLYELKAARTALNEEAAPLLERLESHKRRIENNIDEARLNCRSERPDFDCASRCEQSVRDPIFGTYRMEPSFSCLRDCQARERRAMKSRSGQVSDCVESRDDARAIVRRASDDFDSLRSELMAMDDRLKRLSADIAKILVTRQAVSALHLRLNGTISGSLVNNY